MQGTNYIHSCFPGETALLADFFVRGGEFTVQVDGEQPQYGLNPDISPDGKTPYNPSYVKKDTDLYIEFSESMDDIFEADGVTLKAGKIAISHNGTPLVPITDHMTIKLLPGTRGYEKGLLKITPKIGWCFTGDTCAIAVTMTDRAGNPTGPATISFNVLIDWNPPAISAVEFLPEGNPVANPAPINGKQWISGYRKIRITFSEPMRHAPHWGFSQGLWNGYSGYSYPGSGEDQAQEFVLDRTAGSVFVGQAYAGGTFATWVNATTVDLTPNPSWADSTTGVDTGVEQAIRLYCMDVARNESVIDLTATHKYVVDASKPVLSGPYPDTNFSDPKVEAEITRTQRIVYRFSEAISQSPAPSITGSMMSEAAAPGWTPEFTTCTITPASAWTTGSGKTISISGVYDHVGNPANPASISSSYRVRPLPVAIVTPESGMTIDDSQPIYIKFRRTMSTVAPTVSGSMAAQADLDGSPPLWSTGVYANDTLIIYPKTVWSSGYMIITAKDAGNNDVKVEVSYNVQTAPAIFHYVIDSPSGDVIDIGSPINITFDGEVDATSMALSGSTIVADVNNDFNVSWTANKILTIQPDAGKNWLAGDGKTLKISGLKKLSDGSALPNLRLSYTVLAGVVYVDDTSSSDDDPGTAEYPKTSIQDGVSIADGVYTGLFVPEVHVAGGTYQSDYRGTSNTPVLRMKAGVTVKGSYLRSGWVYGGAVSVLEDVSAVAGGSTDPNCAVLGEETMDSDTVLAGFSIYAASVNYSAGVYLHGGAAPKVQNCYIYGVDITGNYDVITSYGVYISGAAPYLYGNFVNYYSSGDWDHGIDDDSYSYGVYIKDPPHNSTLKMEKNTIIGGARDESASSGTDSTNEYYGVAVSLTQNWTYTILINGNKICGAYNSDNASGYTNSSYGVKITNSVSTNVNIDVRNNVIHGGDTSGCSGTDYVYGVYLGNVSPKLRNNSIYTRGYDNSYGIFLTSGSHPYIQNNIIAIAGAVSSARFCIYESGTNDDPQNVENNDLFVKDYSTDYYLYYDNDTGRNITGALYNDSVNGKVNTIDGGYDTLAAWGNYRNHDNVFQSYEFYDGTFLALPATPDGNVKASGIDGNADGWGWDSWTDITGSTLRTGNGATGWSMGAYENDS